MSFCQRSERGALEPFGRFDARRTEVLGCLTQEPRTRIFGAIDAMPKSHDAFAALECFTHPRLRITRLCNRVEHGQYARWRPTVKWPRERANGRRKAEPNPEYETVAEHTEVAFPSASGSDCRSA